MKAIVYTLPGCSRCKLEIARLEAEGVEVTERSMHDLREGAYRDLDAIAEASMQGWAAPFTVLVED